MCKIFQSLNRVSLLSTNDIYWLENNRIALTANTKVVAHLAVRWRPAISFIKHTVSFQCTVFGLCFMVSLNCNGSGSEKFDGESTNGIVRQSQNCRLCYCLLLLGAELLNKRICLSFCLPPSIFLYCCVITIIE